MEGLKTIKEYGPLCHLKINWSLPLNSFIGNRVLLGLDSKDNLWEEMDCFRLNDSETLNDYQSVSFYDDLTLDQVKSKLPAGFDLASPREALEYSINSFERVGHTLVSGIVCKNGKLMSLETRTRSAEGWLQENIIMNDINTVFPAGTFFVLKKKS